MDVLDSAGASRMDVGLRRQALQGSGAPIHAIACGAADEAGELPAHVSAASSVAEALAIAERWLRSHGPAEVVVASAESGGGAIGRALASRAEARWWPTGIAPRGPLWLRVRRGAPRAAHFGDDSDALAALEGAVHEPPPVGRARAPLWDGDYLLAPLTPGRREGDALLRAFAPVSSLWAGLDLVVLGAADLALVSLARRLGIGARVHFAGSAAPRAERAWVASAAAVVMPTSAGVAATAVLRALACGVPLLPIGDGAMASALRVWLLRAGVAESPAHARFGAEALTRTLERGEQVDRALALGRALAARHSPAAIGAGWCTVPEDRRRAA